MKYEEFKKGRVKKMGRLKELKEKYVNLKDEIDVLKANGSLSKLCNLRVTFDETFDSFFDRKELRAKYEAWDDEENRPNFDITALDLEVRLDTQDRNELIHFYENYINSLEDELIYLTSNIRELD